LAAGSPPPGDTSGLVIVRKSTRYITHTLWHEEGWGQTESGDMMKKSYDFEKIRQQKLHLPDLALGDADFQASMIWSLARFNNTVASEYTD